MIDLRGLRKAASVFRFLSQGQTLSAVITCCFPDVQIQRQACTKSGGLWRNSLPDLKLIGDHVRTRTHLGYRRDFFKTSRIVWRHLVSGKSIKIQLNLLPNYYVIITQFEKFWFENAVVIRLDELIRVYVSSHVHVITKQCWRFEMANESLS